MIIDDLALQADDLPYQLGEFGNSDFLATANIDELRSRVVLEEEYASVGKILDIKKFTPRCPRAPHGHTRCVRGFRLVKSPDQRSDDMGMLGMIIVSRSIEISGQDRYEIVTVLSAICLA